jgi:hypothetical protein
VVSKFVALRQIVWSAVIAVAIGIISVAAALTGASLELVFSLSGLSIALSMLTIRSA